MSLIHQERGGAWYRKSAEDLLMVRVTWPFARLELYDDKIIFKILFVPPIEHSIKSIVSIRKVFYLSFISDGFKIIFSDGKEVGFWSFKNAEKIIRLIEKLKGSNPLP